MNKISMSDCCTKPQKTLKPFLRDELIERGYSVLDEDGFLFAEGELPVMLVAHMDTVHHDNCTIVCTSPDGKYWMSPQGIGGDDRCGIYAIMKITETHKCSILFTEDEEIGCVGAKKYAKFIAENSTAIPKSLNYIVELDRKNANDAVFYSCDNAEFEKFVTTDTGFKTAYGSCSDISYVAPALGVAAVNFSSGYYNPHQTCEYINLAELNENIRRVKAIIDKPSDKFEYIEKVKTTYSYNKSSGSSYKVYDYDYYSRGYYSRYDKEDDSYGLDYEGYQISLWAPQNLAFEDFMLDLGLYAQDYAERFCELTRFGKYVVQDNVKNEQYSFQVEEGNPEKYYQDENFNIFKYDEELQVMVSCDCKIIGREFSYSSTTTKPWFNEHDAEYFYVIPTALYSDFHNYYMENKDIYEEEKSDKKEETATEDNMENDILKLYN